MTPGTLWVDGAYESLAPGCCPNRVYAILFNQQAQAIKPDGDGNWSFQDYTLVTHADFGLVMTEGTYRKKYYAGSVAPAFLTLPVTPDGEEYSLEIWVRRLTSGGFDRSVDELLECRPVFWTGDFLSRTRLSGGDLDSTAEYHPHIQFAYDSQTSTMRFLAWLSRNGLKVADPGGLTVLWSKRDGTPIMNISKPGTLTMASHPGVWKWDLQLIDIDPDDCTPIAVSITDADGNAYAGEAAAVCWD